MGLCLGHRPPNTKELNKMKDNISYELRNRIVEEHLHCINTVIWQN